MGEIQLSKSGHNGKLQQNALKGGVKKEQIKDAKLQQLFNFADKNNDGILDSAEVKNLFATLNADNDQLITNKEAKNYLKKGGAELKELKKEDLYKFLTELTQAAENIETSTVAKSADGKKIVSITYNDGSKETIYPDNKKELTSTENGVTAIKLYENNCTKCRNTCFDCTKIRLQ